MANIETGVDKLVALVAREKKIEVGEAAKRLNVDTAVVQEWAEFLEEEGLVSIQFSLSKTFIVERRLSKDEVVTKDKEYEGRKEAFVRKVDAALKRLEDESAGFESIKKEYDNVKEHIGDEIEAVKEEIEQLRHYEGLKRSIDQDILKQRVEYQRTIDDIHSRLTAEEKRYDKIVGEIGSETKALEREHAEFGDIKREEQDLLKRIQALQDIIKTITTRLDSQSKSVSSHEDRLKTLRTLAEKLRQDLIEKRKRELEPMLKVSNDQAERIMRIQEDIVGKVKQNRDRMQDFEHQSKEISEKFERFFQRRLEIERLIKDTDASHGEIQEGLNELVRKAKAFDLTAKGASVQEHVRALEGQFKDIEHKRGAFTGKLERLRNYIVGKGDPVPATAAKGRDGAKAVAPMATASDKTAPASRKPTAAARKKKR